MALFIKADGTQAPVEPRNGKVFALGELQSLVGGYIELVQLPDGRIMVVDEDGWHKQLPPNEVAGDLADIMILGDAVVMAGNQIS
jgi:hypothetical protein